MLVVVYESEIFYLYRNAVLVKGASITLALPARATHTVRYDFELRIFSSLDVKLNSRRTWGNLRLPSVLKSIIV